jgi:uncharacterized protein YkwD
MSWGTRRQPARRLARTVPRAAVLAAGALALSTAGLAAPAGAAPAQADPVAEVITLTNARRADAGCGPVAPQSELNRAAQGHADDMAAQDYFSHTGKDGSAPWDRAGAQGFTGNGVGENIARGYQTPAAVVEGWMGSEGHRENIENCSWTSIGVGYHPETQTWVQMFGQGDEEASPPPAPAPTPPPADEAPEPEPPADEMPAPDDPPAAAPATPVVREPSYTG